MTQWLLVSCDTNLLVPYGPMTTGVMCHYDYWCHVTLWLLVPYDIITTGVIWHHDLGIMWHFDYCCHMAPWPLVACDTINTGVIWPYDYWRHVTQWQLVSCVAILLEAINDIRKVITKYIQSKIKNIFCYCKQLFQHFLMNWNSRLH